MYKRQAQVNIGSKETQIIYGDKETVEVAVSSDKRKTRALNDREILELMKCGLEIEKHYGMPMDIEWAIKNDIAVSYTHLQRDSRMSYIARFFINI